MKVPERISLVRQIADILEEQIISNGWHDQLPGYRKLCETLGVSPRTVYAALDLLERRKIVLPAENGRPRRIHAEFSSRASGLNARNALLVLSGVPVRMLSIHSREVIERVCHQFQKKGWEIEFASDREFEVGKPGRRMEKLRRDYPHHRWLLATPNLDVVKWCVARSLRIVCLGGNTGELRPPCVGVSRVGMLADGVLELARLGHRRICSLAVFGDSDASRQTHDILARAFLHADIPFQPLYHLISLEDGTPEALWETLERLFRLTPPTALIASDSLQVPTIYSYCLAHNLRIPEDVSLIVTQQGRHLKWFRPRPAYYQFPIDQFVRKIVRWIENYPSESTDLHLLEPTLMRGESITRVL